MSFSEISSAESLEGVSNYIQTSIIPNECWLCSDYNLEEELNEIQEEQSKFSIQFELSIMTSDVIIANLSDEEIQEEYENEEKTEILHKLQKVFKKKCIKRERKLKFQNECRYIIGNAIQAMNQFDLSDEFKSYYRRIASSITGYQVLRQHLIVEEGDGNNIVIRKRLFQEYLLLFLKKKATLFILKSKKKQNLRDYLQYKNQILMYYIRYPQLWNGNQLPHFDTQQHQY